MSIPRYPEYKDSGVDWLGEVPSHWEVTKLGYISNRIGSGKTPTGGALAYVPNGVVFIRSQNVHDDGLRLDDVVFISEATDREMAWSRVKPLDVLLNITGASIGRTCLVPASFAPANVNQHVCVIRLQKPESLSKWVAVAMTAPATKNQVDVNQTGAAREGLNFEQVSGFQICVPPEEERGQIARFLDHETAKIDALIQEQQRLIKLLKEKRQAVISQAVTKGLDPSVPMKDSGVEWLGEVPAHWEVKPLRYVSTMIDGDRSSNYPNEDDLVDEGIPFVSSKNIVGYKFTDKNLNFITPEKFSSLGRGKLRHGDLVITVRGTIGHVAVFDSAIIGSNEGFINAQMMIIRPEAGLTGYIRLCSESSFWQKQLDVAAYGSTVQQLSNPIVGGVVIALPPRTEIPQLVFSVEVLEAEFEALISEAQIATGLLQERRSALISAAVTGKIDVRNWKPPADESAFDEEVRQAGLEVAS